MMMVMMIIMIHEIHKQIKQKQQQKGTLILYGFHLEMKTHSFIAQS